MRQLAYIVLGLLALAALGVAGRYAFETYFFYSGPSEKWLSMTGYNAVVAEGGRAETSFYFEPSYPFWSDGAEKRRYVYLPPGKKIDNHNPDRWNFPKGTRIWKKFVRDGVLVEIRMLYKFGDDAWSWDMSTYRWRQDRSDAYKVMFARSNVGKTAHDIPAPSQCVTCHSDGENRRVLGLTAIQLPWSHDKKLSMTKLIAANLLSNPPDAGYRIPGNSVARTALGYLDTNCGSCHYDGSTFVPPEVPLFLNLTTSTLDSVYKSNAYRTAISRQPHVAGLGTEVYVKPGSPEDSFLYLRMNRRDSGGWQMPPLATEKVDDQGVEKIRDWILALADGKQ